MPSAGAISSLGSYGVAGNSYLSSLYSNTDFSSGALPAGLVTAHDYIPGMSRSDRQWEVVESHPLGAWLFGTSDITRNDWTRSEASANNQYLRQLALDDASRAFNASEAEKNRNWQERMSNTAYQRALSDMKKAGVNPILAFSQGGATSPSGSLASSSSGGTSRGSSSAKTNNSDLLSSILKVVAGIVASL